MKTKLSALIISLFAVVSVYAAGDIYEIRPCDEYGHNTSAYSSYDEPLGSGSSNVYFNVRLKLRGTGTDPNRTAFRRWFQLDWLGALPGETEESMRVRYYHDLVQNPLKIGIYVSGKLRYASLKDCYKNIASGTNYFDCVFCYKPQPGDFALPVYLAVKDDFGDPRPAFDNNEASEYYFEPESQNYWKISYHDLDDTSREGDVSWKYTDNAAQPGGLKPNGVSGSSYVRVVDVSLEKAGIFVKTVDFDDKVWDDPQYWSTVHETETKSFRIKVDVNLTNVMENATFYVWSMDESGVQVVGEATEIITNYLGGAAQTMTNQVATVVVGPDGIGEFEVTGIASNHIAEIVLSPWKGFNFQNSLADKPLKDFVTTKIKCEPPLEPTAQLSFSPTGATGSKAKSLTCNPELDSLDGITNGIPVYVYLTEAPTNDFLVGVKMYLSKAGLEDMDIISNHFIAAELESDNYKSSKAYEATTNVLVKMASYTKSSEPVAVFYIYALGGNPDTQSEGITLELKLPTGSKYVKGDDCTLKIKDRHTPAVVEATTETDYGERELTGFDANVEISDCPRDFWLSQTTDNLKFKVEVTPDSGTAYTTNLAFKVGTVTKVPIMNYTRSATYAIIRITDPDCDHSTQFRINFTVKPQKTIKVDSWYDVIGTETVLHAGTSFFEGKSILPKFTVTGDASDHDIYIFLEPQNAASSNLVACKAMSAKGIPLWANTTETELNDFFKLELLDGCAATDGTDGQLSFRLVTRKGQAATSDIDTTYTPVPELINLSVRNVFPEQKYLYINGNPTSVKSGTHFPDPVPSGAGQTNVFSATVTDVSMIDKTNGLYVVWNFSEGFSFARSYQFTYTYSTNGNVQCDHSFLTPGTTQTVQSVAIDKDMLAAFGGTAALSNLNTLWANIVEAVGEENIYKATVFVSDAPYIKLFNESDLYSFEIPEDAKFADGYKLNISLSQGALQRLRVKLTATCETGEGPDYNGAIKFTNGGEYWIEAGTTTPATAPSYIFADLDGAPGGMDLGWTVKAEVVYPAALTNYYMAGEAVIRVVNRPPVISPVQNTTTNKSIAAGELFNIEGWSAKDCAVDLAKGLTAKWYIDGMIQVGATVYNITNNSPHTVSNLVINSDGLHEVKLVVTDKDGESYDGLAERIWLYYIKPTKKLEVRPYGPATSTISDYYDAAGGRGRGRVFANGIRSQVQNFVQTWYFNVEDPEADIWAAGYASAPAPYNDDGNLGTGVPKRDVALDANGEKYAPGVSTAYYQYDGKYDNYFYRWVYAASKAEGGSPTNEYSSVKIVLGNGVEVKHDTPYRLDPFVANKTGYLTRTVEAIFSREYYPQDNLGDINADGIPDLFTKKHGLGIFGEKGVLIGDDSDADIAAVWEDGDSLPTSTNLTAHIGFGVTNTWSMSAIAFDPRQEIRGYDDRGEDGLKEPTASHFNDTYEILASQAFKYYVPDFLDNAGNMLVKADKNFIRPAYNSLGLVTNGSTLSYVEYIAFSNYCVKMGWDLTDESHWGLQPGTGYDDSWSPERPTNPAVKDTDKDGLDDGFEYYVWYRAHVGTIEKIGTNMVHRLAVGHRYNQYDPGNPIEIPAEELERLFDPLTGDAVAVATRDTDNDGLTDIEEFVYGTNPFEWDTDGDGLPDGWEIKRLGSEPLETRTFSVLDGLLNEDHDQMAWMTNKMHMVCELILDGDGNITGTNAVYFSEKEFKTVGSDNTNRHLVAAQQADFRCYRGWVYGIDGPWAIETPGIDDVTGFTNVCVSADKKDVPVVLMHYQVYWHEGFDPRTAWNDARHCKPNHIKDTKPFTALDEFLLCTFYWKNGGIKPENMPTLDVNPDNLEPRKSIWDLWNLATTDPNKADTDDDGMPDGWELYLQAPNENEDAKTRVGVLGPGCAHSPVHPYSDASDTDPAPGGDGLMWPDEFNGWESCYRYSDCPTIVNNNPEWYNKIYPTNPWDNDTDGDGIPDGAERTSFNYGGTVRAADSFDGCTPGGGLNPLTWDTDGDLLPDPFEVEFAGSATVTTEPDTTMIVDNDDGTATTNTVLGATTASWGGGMNGTVNDAMEDYDNDGLKNWQEYMVGTMRCWRYDDPITTWHCHEPDPGRFTNDAYLYSVLCDPASPDYDPGMRSMHCHPGVYMSWCSNKWDTAYGKFYYFKDGIYHDLKRDAQDKSKNNQNRWHLKIPMFPPPPFAVSETYPEKYICCDPTKRDTDEDGMDDFYELYHGLNPLLGGEIDVVNESWGGPIAWSADANYWTVYELPFPEWGQRLKGRTDSASDFVQWVWKAGRPTADPDGDNIRNIYESIQSHIQGESTYLHTDPTPLWMTDISYEESLTYKYYLNADPYWNAGGIIAFMHPSGKFTHTWTDEEGHEHKEVYNLNDFPWLEYDEELGICFVNYDINYWSILDTMFSFEQTEGYDTDCDYLGDFEEGQGKTKSASDPQYHDDPLRRQAMYFGGEDDPGFLQTSLQFSEMTPGGATAAYDMPFLYFTVECWAKADDSDVDSSRLQVMVERPIWTGEANAADESYLRKNFLIGLKGGRWYTKFDSTGTDRKQAVEITDGPQATTNWTHIAATYDGHALKLYVNGVCCNTHVTSIQPEHGMSASFIDVDGMTRTDAEWAPVAGNRAMMYPLASILVGADAQAYRSICPDLAWHERNVMWPYPHYYLEDDAARMSDYGGFFKGYVDEVRIWDGARSGADILADVKNRVRYTREEALANRNQVFAEIQQGLTRSPLSPTELCPELKFHFSFDHVPGAVDPDDMVNVPAGFRTSEGTTDGMAIWARPPNWESPWLTSFNASIRSKYFTDRAWTPWIINTVSHLPRIDGLTRDSLFWSENFAGGVPASSNGVARYSFARTAEPQCNWYQQLYVTPAGLVYSQTYPTYSGERYEFAMRETTTDGQDLLPFGGAFPKRISTTEGGMWDGLGAADAWAETGNDSDHNGLPNWWEEYARQNLSAQLEPWEDFQWDTTVIYDGLDMPAWRAYLRDLAAGLLPDGIYYDGKDGKLDFRDTRDLDRDGMPDWWEDMYGINTGDKSDAKADPDHDGLSNYQEYRIECDGLYHLDPMLARSYVGQLESDYYLQTTNSLGETVYLGELYADHDFMEDDAEDENGFDRTRYDAWADPDEDGWSNFAEVRYAGFKMDIASRFLTHYFGDTEIRDFPIPVIHSTLRYHGETGGANSTNVIFVEVYSGNNLQKAPNATYRIATGTKVSREIYLGAWGDRVVHGTLTPGHVQEGIDNIKLECAFIQQNDEWAWSAGDVAVRGTYKEMLAAYSADPTIKIAKMDFAWMALNSDVSDSIVQLSVDDKTQKGYLMVDLVRAGEIDLITGDFSFDLGKLKGKYIQATDGMIPAEYMFYRLGYTSNIPTMQSNKLPISLASPDEGVLSEGKTAFVAWMDKDGNGAFTPGVDPVGFVKDVDVGWDMVPAIDIEMTDSSQAAGKRFSYASASNDIVRIVRIGVNGSTEGVAPRIIYSRDITDATRDYVFEGDLVSAGKFGLDWDNLRSDLQTMDGIKLKDVTSVDYAVIDGATSMQNIDTNSFLTTFSVDYTSEAIKPVSYSPSEKADGIVRYTRPVFRWTGADGYTAFRLQVWDDAGANKLYDSDVLVLPARDSSSRYYWEAPLFIGTNVTDDAWVLDNHKSYQWRVAMYNAKFSDTSDGASLWSDWAVMRAELNEVNDSSVSPYGSVKTTVKYFGPATNSLDQIIVQLFKNADFTGKPAAQTRLFDVSGDITDLTNGVEVVFNGLEKGTYYAVAFIDRTDAETGKGDGLRQRYETWGYSAQVGLNVAAIWNPLGAVVDAENVEIPSLTVYMEDTDVNGDGILDWNQDEDLLKAASTSAAEASLAGDSDGDGLSDFDEGDKSYTKANKWDTDGDGMPDGWEYAFAGTDPLTPDSDKVVDGELMAYAEYASRVITVRSTATGATETYIVPGTNEYFVGNNVNGQEFFSTYDYNGVYGRGKMTEVKSYENYDLAEVTNTLGGATYKVIFESDVHVGVGTNVNEETCWIPAGPDGDGFYSLVAKTNLNVSALVESNVVVAVEQVKVSLGENRIIRIEEGAKVALVHSQVYDEFGFSQTVAVDPSDEHTKPFTALDKYLVIRYLSAIGIGPGEEEINKRQLWKYYSLVPGIVDGDGISDITDTLNAADKYGDGIADGWELYVMFGTEGTTNAPSYATPSATKVNPWKYADRSVDIDADALDLLHEYSDGKDPSDPWDAYSVYKIILKEGVIEESTDPFMDSEVRRFGVKKDDINGDWDLDMISNGQEVWGYYKDRVSLADICETNAWSNGTGEKPWLDGTPDYFRTFTNKVGGASVFTYLGEYYNGAEFIEPKYRTQLDLLDEEKAGTRDYNDSGWDYWSIARFMQSEDASQLLYTNTLDFAAGSWPNAYGYGVVVDDPDLVFSLAPQELKRLQRAGNLRLIEVTKLSVTNTAANAGGQAVAVIHDEFRWGYLDLTFDGFNAPSPDVKLALKYVGNDSYPVVVEAYQVSSAYPEYGEQLTARWNKNVKFDAGVGRTILTAADLVDGSLKQGNARFVAYIDDDGVAGFSTGDTHGTSEITVGFYGIDLEMMLGKYNPALPVIKLDDGASNLYQTVAIVRTKINGQYVATSEGTPVPRGVMLRKYWNNIGRGILYPEDYIDTVDGYVGLDKHLAFDSVEGKDPSDEKLATVESVTYEIVKIYANQIADLDSSPSKISFTNLNHYAYTETIEDEDGTVSNVTHIVDQNRNEEFTVRFPLNRDVPKTVVADGSATADDFFISFEVPVDGYAVTKFFLDISGVGTDADGYLLPRITGNKVILDRKWFADNGIVISGSHTVRVALGNDKFPKDPGANDEEWSDYATFTVNAAKVSDGKLFVQVKHPLTNFTGNVTIAAYRKGDLAEPEKVWTGKATDQVYTLDDLNRNGNYYIAAWYVKDAGDGRDSAKERKPWDTWGYLTEIGESSSGFNAKVVSAVVNPAVTNTFWLQDTDWNDNNVIDRLETIAAIDGVRKVDDYDYYATGDLDLDGVIDLEDDDPVFDNGNDVRENDVMAYAEVNMLCVQLGSVDETTNWVWYAVCDPEHESAAVKVSGPVYIPRGTKATDLKSIATTYVYGKRNSKTIGFGTNLVSTASLAGWEVKNYEYKQLALMHWQVYDRFGFNPNTANGQVPSGQWVNTKSFTSKDKYFVTNYLAAIGAVVDPNTFTNWVLNAKRVDYDFDGMPDGWELYTMFGNGKPKVLVKSLVDDVVNPWVREDRNGDPDNDGLVNFQEYDGGYSPTDPFNVDTDNDGIKDSYAQLYHLKNGDSGRDFDGDGLSNYAEYLISEVFGFAQLDPDSERTDGYCLDYFRKVGELYLGEIFTDHDQVDDAWEDAFARSAADGELYANRYVYDPARDADEDGWSNYAEAMAGTDPTRTSSVGIDGYAFAQYPVPTVTARLVYNGKSNNITAPIVFQAWNQVYDPDMTGEPDAVWTAPTSDSDASSSINSAYRYIGVNPGAKRTICLGPGSVSPGSVRICFRDLAFKRVALVNNAETASYTGESGDSKWYEVVQDVNGVLMTGVSNQVTQVQVGTIDYETGMATIDFSAPALQTYLYVMTANAKGNNSQSDNDKTLSRAFYNGEKLDLSTSYVRVAWGRVRVGTSVNGTFYLAEADKPSEDVPSRGYLREGLNSFVVFADIDGNGEYTAGEPFGFVRDVDVGWYGASFSCELTDVSPIFARVNLLDGTTDRGYWHIGGGTVSSNLEASVAEGRHVRVRVVRDSINGIKCDADPNHLISERVVMDKIMNLDARAYLHEGDFLYDSTLGKAMFDIDWERLDSDKQEWYHNFPDLTNITYRIVFGDGDTNAMSNRLFRLKISRDFDDYGSTRYTVLPKIGPETEVVTYSTRPTFRWSINEGVTDFNTYTAFRIKVYSDKACSKLVYDSDIRRMPPRSVRDGVEYYTWVAPSIIGTQLSVDEGSSYLSANSNYYWRVGVYNARFFSDGADAKYCDDLFPELIGTLVTRVNVTQDGNDHGYSAIPVCVKYTGPSKVLEKVDDMNELMGTLRVQAFETPDFCGEPVSETVVTGAVNIASVTNLLANGKLIGLPANSTYYLRAYIDSNGNLERDEWESWGQAKVVAEAGQSEPVGIYIEDADTDDDWIPDAYEFAMVGWPEDPDAFVGGWKAELGKNISGEFVVNSDLYNRVTTVTQSAGISTGMSGASLTVFTYDEVAKLVLSDDRMSFNSVDDIRKAVQKKIKENTVRISSITLDPNTSTVWIGVNAEVTQSIAGEFVSRIYNFSSTANVTVKVYRRDTLAEQWSPLPVATVPVTVSSDLSQLVPVKLSEVDMSTGFFKVVVEQ